ncbi:MAG: FliH/SctL family protein [Bryobacteraceae bacterium]
MSSRVLTGSKNVRAEPVRWLMAFGEPVNAATGTEEFSREAPSPSNVSKEMEGALQRIQVLDRRIHELEADLHRRQEIGRQEGRAEGEKLGAMAANAALQPLMDRLASTIGELASYRARFRRDSEPELLRLALAVARKILRRELTVDPHSLLGILKAALETINQAEVLCIRTAPEDVPQLSGKLAGLGLPDQVEVIADRALERGSVVLDTKRGQIDASVQTQLAEIENGFADRIAAQNHK